MLFSLTRHLSILDLQETRNSSRRAQWLYLRKVKSYVLILLSLTSILAVYLPAIMPLAHATPIACTSTSPCALSPKVTNAFNAGLGYIASEVKVDQSSSAYYDGQTTAYGGTGPHIWIGLEGMLSNSARSMRNPEVNIQTLQISVTITDSSGNAFSPQADSNNRGGITTSIWDTPHSTGDSTDYAGLITDLSTWLIGALGVPTPLNMATSQSTRGTSDGLNGLFKESNTVRAQWTYYPDGFVGTSPPFGNNWVYNGNTVSAPLWDKAIRLELVPNFLTPDVYTIAISTKANRGYCDLDTSYAANIDCNAADTQTQTYSFKYVYESDAGNDGDASDSLPSAGGNPRSINQRGSFTGFLYGVDTADVYSFLVGGGEIVAFAETPPSTAEFRLTVYDTDGLTRIQTADQGIGATSGIQFTSSSGGTYFAMVEIVSGWGAYSFRLTNGFKMSASPSTSSLGLAGTSSSVTSTITLGSVGNFNDRVALSASVSPSVPNALTTSFNVVSSQVVISPTTDSSTNVYSPHLVNYPERAFVQDDLHAFFQSATDNAGAVIPADYDYGYTLPSTAGISKLEVGPVHFESTCCGNPDPTPIPSVIVGGQSFSIPNNIHYNTGCSLCPQPTSWYTQSWIDISSQIPQITSTQFSLTYQESSTGTSTEGYVDWLPIRVTYTSVPLSPGSSDSRVLTVSSSASTPPGIYTVTVTGSTTGGISLTVPVTVTVQDFQITTDVQSMKLSIGQSATTTITVSPVNGFTGTVTLFVSAPGGYTAGLTTNTVAGGSGTSVLTISHTGTAQFDPATITVSGVSGARTQTTSITVINPPPTFSLSSAPSSIVITAGQSKSLTITVTSLYGFTGSVSLIQSTPSGLTCSALNPSTVSLTSSTTTATSTLSCSASPASVYTLNVTGTSGSIVISTFAPFTVQGPPSLDGSTWSSCSHNTNSCSATLSTSHSNDIIIVYAMEVLDLQPSCTFSVTDTAGLTWTSRGGVSGRNDGTTGYNRDQLQEFWAYSTGKLSSDTITESISGCAGVYGGEYNGLQAFGVTGANFNNPFDPNTSLPGLRSGGSTVPSVTISTSNTNDMIIGVVQYSNGALSQGTGFTAIISVGGASSEYLLASSTVTNYAVGFGNYAPQYWESIADAIQA